MRFEPILKPVESSALKCVGHMTGALKRAGKRFLRLEPARERQRQEVSRQGKPHFVDAMPHPRRKMPLHRQSESTQGCRGGKHRAHGDHLIGAAMRKKNGRFWTLRGRRIGQKARKTHNASDATPQSQMQRQHGALAEPGKNQALGREAQPPQLSVQEFTDAWRGNRHATLHLMGIEPGNRKPLETRRRAWHAVRRMGRDKGRARKHFLPMRDQPDQVVAIGAITVEQHDQLGGLAVQSRHART